MKFRIVTDNYAGFAVEAEHRVGFKNAWEEISFHAPGNFGTNTFRSLEEAEAWVRIWSTPKTAFVSQTVKELELP